MNSPFSPATVVRSTVAALLFALAGCGGDHPAKGQAPAPLWTDSERQFVAAYWNAPGRYTIEPSPDVKQRVNVTVAGSIWYNRYLSAVNARPKGDMEAAGWDTWVKAKLLFDRQIADSKPAVEPGPIPPALIAAVGAAPPLYEVVHPQRYTVTFAPDDAPAPFVYTDSIPFGDRKAYYGYYRQANGVIRPGKRVKDYAGDDRKSLDALFATVGRSDAERHVLQAVSSLEGGFESINTYDTGFVSVGLIQFIFARDGDGSLSAVLAQMKNSDPAAFQADFHRFGVDVGADTVVSVLDPTAATEKHGADAVQAVINDKRLTAVFERAGGHDAFRRAQVLVARERYWAGDDPVAVPRTTVYEQHGDQATPTLLGVFFGVPGAIPEVLAAQAKAADVQKTDPKYRVWTEAAAPLTAKVSDVIKSEAGLATLMDRKVNRGNIRGLNEAIADVLRTHHGQKIDDAIPYEREIITQMKYRADFLKDASLTQPPVIPPAATAVTTRRNTRPAFGRGIR